MFLERFPRSSIINLYQNPACYSSWRWLSAKKTKRRHDMVHYIQHGLTLNTSIVFRIIKRIYLYFYVANLFNVWISSHTVQSFGENRLPTVVTKFVLLVVLFEMKLGRSWYFRSYNKWTVLPACKTKNNATQSRDIQGSRRMMYCKRMFTELNPTPPTIALRRRKSPPHPSIPSVPCNYNLPRRDFVDPLLPEISPRSTCLRSVIES